MSEASPLSADHHPGDGARRHLWRRWIRTAFGAITSGLLLVALIEKWPDLQSQLLQSPRRLLWGVFLITLSVSALAHAWSTLMPPGANDKRMRRVFYLAQPAKYVPGGIAQIVGQVALTASEGVATATASVAFVVHALVGVAAGALLGSGAALVAASPTWLRLVAAVGVGAPILLWRPLLARPVELLAKVTSRPVDTSHIPSQRQILSAFIWALMGLCATAGSFAVLSMGTIPVPTWQTALAFSLAFTVGYVALPFPSGIGVREAVLALVLGGVGLATVAAVSAIHRIATMVGELLMVAVTSRRN